VDDTIFVELIIAEQVDERRLVEVHRLPDEPHVERVRAGNSSPCEDA